MIKSIQAATVAMTAILGLGFLGACGQSPSTTSDVKVTNGVQITETTFPSTVLLVMQMAEGEALCTGTFINDSQVVTAGHCVEGQSATKPAIYFAVEKNGKMNAVARALTFKRNPNYSIAKGVSPSDVSVITFPANSAPAVTAIADETPAVGTAFTIVGYGNNKNYKDSSGVLSGDGAGVKREGTNVIGANDSGMLRFLGVTGLETVAATDVGTYVSSGEGDSGGPLLVDGKIAGVTSGGGLVKGTDGSDIAMSMYVDLNSAESKAFLATVVKTSNTLAQAAH